MAQTNSDAALLFMLQKRDEGASCSEIARMIGTTKSRVAGALWRIKVEDEIAHGERPA